MKRKATKPITFQTVCEIAFTHPGVEIGTSYRTPALKVKNKLLARLREDGDSVAFIISFDEREILMQAKPETFFITDHYQNYPAVLLRLSTATRQDAETVVERSWKYVTGKRTGVASRG